MIRHWPKNNTHIEKLVPFPHYTNVERHRKQTPNWTRIIRKIIKNGIRSHPYMKKIRFWRKERLKHTPSTSNKVKTPWRNSTASLLSSTLYRNKWENQYQCQTPIHDTFSSKIRIKFALIIYRLTIGQHSNMMTWGRPYDFISTQFFMANHS